MSVVTGLDSASALPKTLPEDARPANQVLSNIEHWH